MQGAQSTSAIATAIVQASTVISHIPIGSVRPLRDIPPVSSAASLTSSAGLAFGGQEVDVVMEEGLKHSQKTLEARQGRFIILCLCAP